MRNKKKNDEFKKALSSFAPISESVKKPDNKNRRELIENDNEKNEDNKDS